MKKSDSIIMMLVNLGFITFILWVKFYLLDYLQAPENVNQSSEILLQHHALVRSRLAYLLMAATVLLVLYTNIVLLGRYFIPRLAIRQGKSSSKSVGGELSGLQK